MTFPDIAEVKDLAAVPRMLAPHVAKHGLLFVFCEDVTGRLLVSPSAEAQPGAEMVCKIGPKGSLGAPQRGACSYPRVGEK